MSKIQTHIIGLLTALNTSSPIISVAYAEQSLTHELQADQAGGRPVYFEDRAGLGRPLHRRAGDEDGLQGGKELRRDHPGLSAGRDGEITPRRLAAWRQGRVGYVSLLNAWLVMPGLPGPSRAGTGCVRDWDSGWPT